MGCYALGNCVRRSGGMVSVGWLNKAVARPAVIAMGWRGELDAS